MSLVICSNQEKDGTSERQKGSIYNAWSFRNPLSSTMTIPADAQVALQSCKVNVDGRAVFSRNNHRFYHYFGDKLDLDGTTAPQIEDSTSYPAITTLTNENDEGQVVALGTDDLAIRIQEQIRSTTYHPNCKELFECSVLRNDDSSDFLGYSFNFKQNASNSNVNNRPADNGFEDFYTGEDPAFTYIDNVFKRTEQNEFCTGIATAQPFSLTNGSFIVEINNGSFANVNSSGVEWQVGLSRYINIPVTGENRKYPPYAVIGDMGELDFTEDCFMDFGIGRDNDGNMRCFHFINDPTEGDGNNIMRREVKYYSNGNGSFQDTEPFDLANGSDAAQYTKVGFFSEGENLAVKLYHNGSTEWRLVTEFDSGQDASTYFKPVNQACWCLHPVLVVGEDDTDFACTMRVEEFSGLGLTDYDPKTANKGGWYETLELVSRGTGRCQELENRAWNTTTGNTRDYKLLNASGGVNYSFVIIPEQSNIYTPTFGANARQILGFNQQIVDVPNTVVSPISVIFQSSKVPSLTSSMAMFVKLNNFGQSVINAHNGNPSKIIAHLPRFDNTQETGRLYFEPNQMVFIDLNNPAPIQVNEFDISFSYINEQYATILTGQSIVALYFRKKPRELS